MDDSQNRTGWLKSWLGRLVGKNPRKMLESYYQERYEWMVRVAAATEAGDFDRASGLLLEFLSRYSDDPMAHTFASAVYYKLNNIQMALIEAVMAAFLESDRRLAGLHYHRVARLLSRMGHTELAQTLLKVGWTRCQSLYPSSKREEKRMMFFAVDDDINSL